MSVIRTLASTENPLFSRASMAAAAIDAGGQPLSGVVQVESVPNDLRPNPERATDQIDA